MRKWLLIVCLVIPGILCTLYFLIPTTPNLKYQFTVNCTETGASRHIINKNKWQFWWPGNKSNDTVYSYQNYKYRIDKILLDGFETTVFNTKDSVKGFLQFTDYGNDSTQFLWTSAFIFSANPFKRFKQYVQLKEIGNNVKNLLDDIKNKFDNPENIYGMKIVEQKVTDSSMISIKSIFPQYPTTQEIYDMIDSINNYIKENGGDVNDYPMLNVHENGPAAYEAMVAIPTKSDLQSEGKFQLKKMVLGNILMAEVKGGVYTVIKGEQELRNYVNDYHKISPAISFQSLVTNRLSETDSAKWITRLYYPVFQ
jgi:hypothetical protein